jgi:hypothetical protein
MSRTMTVPNRALFESLVHQELEVRSPTGEALTRLLLAQVEPLAGAKDAESFRLTFRGPLNPALGQGVYLFDHAQLSAEAIFVVPVVRDETQITYEAIFNRG